MHKSRRCVQALEFLFCLVLSGLWSWHALPTLSSAPTPTASVQQSTEAPTLSTKRIEEVQLGERLLGQNPLRDEVDESFPEVDPATWRQLRLHMTKPSGKSLFIELLRPLTWLNETGAAVGGLVHLDAKEMGVTGEAKVLAIEPCPTIQDGPGNVCTGRFIHEADGNLLDLTLADQAEITTTTPTHPYWSEDRRDFIPAGDLRPGERLKTAFGETTVVSIAPSPKNEQVYNLEIHREHVYLVGSVGSLVHNAAACAGCPTGGGGVPGKPLQGEYRGRTINVETRKINLRKGDPAVQGSGIEYAWAGHGGAGANSKSQFSITKVRLKELLQRSDVIKSPIRQSGTTGNYIRELDVGEIVGNLPVNKGGGSTSVLTVITDVKGSIVNTFPGTLGRRATLPP